MSCCCGRQGFGERQRGATCTVWRKHRTHSATLPLSESLPTTTTGHYTICCKKSQSCAPEDGQKFSRNMLSWSWRSINYCCCISLVFYITLPTLMMHGQTQIKFATVCLGRKTHQISATNTGSNVATWNLLLSRIEISCCCRKPSHISRELNINTVCRLFTKQYMFSGLTAGIRIVMNWKDT